MQLLAAAEAQPPFQRWRSRARFGDRVCSSGPLRVPARRGSHRVSLLAIINSADAGPPPVKPLYESLPHFMGSTGVQAARGHQRSARLRGLAPRYRALIADRMAAAPADMDALPRVYAALGAHFALGTHLQGWKLHFSSQKSSVRRCWDPKMIFSYKIAEALSILHLVSSQASVFLGISLELALVPIY